MSMDSVELSELLECSVCLERLDQTSKVLPCQHTFCRRCLKEIQAAKKELRCPECRVLVDEDIDDLPSNILLVRILEGLNNRKRPKSSNSLEQRASTEQRVTKHPTAKALFDYEPKEQGDLPLSKGDIVILLRQVDENWYEGQVNGCQGFLPANYVEVINALPCLDDDYDDPVAKALYDFNGGLEADILAFKQGDIITVIRRVDENWCEGKLNNKCGIFPINFVEFNSVARAIMESLESSPSSIPRDSFHCAGVASTSASNGRPANGAPMPKPARKSKAQEKAAKRHTIHGNELEQDCNLSRVPSRHSVEITSSERLQQTLGNVAAAVRADPPVTNSLVGDLSGNSTRSNPPTPQSTTESSRRSPNEFMNGNSPTQTRGAVDTSPLTVNMSRPSTSAAPATPSLPSTSQNSTGTPPRPGSAEIGKELYVALYNYKPMKEDELELKQGENYCVIEKCKDGWFKGFSLGFQHRGVFPGNYVRLASIHSLLTRSRSSNSAQQAPLPSPRQYTRPVNQAPVQARPRYHRSESTPSFQSRSAPPPTENMIVNTESGRPDSASDLGPEDPLIPIIPPPPIPKTGSFWKKLKNKKKDRTSQPPPPPPPYTRNVPSGHTQVSLPPPSRTVPVTPPPPYTPQPRPYRHAAQVARESRPRQRQENVPVSERYRVVMPYPPQSQAELELRVGDIVFVTKKRQDGWYKGTLERNGKTGLFPGCFSEKF